MCTIGSAYEIYCALKNVIDINFCMVQKGDTCLMVAIS